MVSGLGFTGIYELRKEHNDFGVRAPNPKPWYGTFVLNRSSFFTRGKSTPFRHSTPPLRSSSLRESAASSFVISGGRVACAAAPSAPRTTATEWPKGTPSEIAKDCEECNDWTRGNCKHASIHCHVSPASRHPSLEP